VAQPAHPHEEALGQPEARAHRGDVLWRALVHGRVRRLRDHHDLLARQAQVRERVARDRLGGDDHTRRALHREVAQAQAQATAQVLAAALERRQVVDRDDHRARAVQHRSVHPRRVEHVRAARARERRRTVRLDDLIASRGGLEQRRQQAPRIAPDAVRIGHRTAVERDPHREPPAVTRFPRSASRQH